MFSILNRKQLFPALIYVVLLAGLLRVGGPVPAFAVDPPQTPHAPYTGKICIGYNPEAKTWGRIGIYKEDDEPANCPRGYAYVGTSNLRGTRRDGSRISVFGDCCPMPDDALTDEHVFVHTTCPDDFVATGAKQEVSPICDTSDWQSCKRVWETKEQQMRCTRINTQRYKLDNPLPLSIWGWQPHFRNLFIARTTKSNMPVALRYGAGRDNQTQWSREGCIALPWGSLLVGKSSKYCDGFTSRQLLYRGAAGDPANGTPVKILADCDAISDPLSSDAVCVTH